MLEDKNLPKKVGSVKLTTEEVRDRLKDLQPGWKFVKPGALYKKFSFKKYKTAMLFAYQVGLIAERENHHPEILVTYSGVQIALSTHSVKGVTSLDFLLAGEIEAEFATFQ